MADRDQSSWASAAELAGRIRRRELSPVELMSSTIQRIEQRNPSLNAFVFTDFDQAMERARAAEASVTSGANLGPLHGVPTPMKDPSDFSQAGPPPSAESEPSATRSSTP